MTTIPGLAQESLSCRFEVLGPLGVDGHALLARDRVRGTRFVLHAVPAIDVPLVARRRIEGVEIFAADDGIYVARPFVEGTPLSELAEIMPVTKVIALARSCLGALSELHASGIIHRNIRPSNVILHEGETAASIVDVGLNPAEQRNIALEQLPIDAVQYLSPEQLGLLKRSVGVPSDLYALGLVLFRCLTGKRTFPGVSVGEILDEHLRSEIPDVRDLGAHVPRAAAEILRRMVREDPDERYQSARAVIFDLESLDRALGHGAPDPALLIGARDTRSTLTEPGLVGMKQELMALDLAVDAARGGKGGLVRLEGKSGSGKTRLLRELGTRGRASGARVFRGHARAQLAGPFEALGSAMSELAAHVATDPSFGARVRERLGHHRSVVLASLPLLEAALGPGDPLPPVDEAPREVRALAALGALLDSLGEADRPAVIALDDMQWADPSTVKLLSRWARRESDSFRTLVVCTFRSEEVPASSLLRTISPAGDIGIDPLSDDDARDLLGSAAGPLPELAVTEAARLSLSSPFMALAVLHAMSESRALKPTPGEAEGAGGTGWTFDPDAMTSFRAGGHTLAVLSRRLELLPADTHLLLRLAAILGRDFDLDCLATFAERAEGGTMSPEEALRVAVERHLLWPSRDGKRFAFVHDAIREALLASTSEEETLRLHRLAGTMLEERDRTAVVEIAFHFDAAHEYERALPYALKAADLARRRLALETAERQYRIAEKGMAAREPETQRRVLVGLGEVLLLLGRYEESERRLESALLLVTRREEKAHLENLLADIALNRGDARGAVRRIGSALRGLGERVPESLAGFALASLKEALVQALHTALPGLFVGGGKPASPSELSVVRLYSRLAYAFYFVGTIPALWAHLRELNLAERHPPGRELAQAYSGHGIIMAAIPLFARALRYSEKALCIRRALGDVWGEGQALHFHGRTLYAASRFTDAIASSAQAMRLLEHAGDRWEYDDAAAVEALSYFALGDLKTATSLAKALYRAADEIGDVHPRALALQLWSRASGGNVPAELVARALTFAGSHVLASSSLLVAKGVRLLHDGEVELATAAFEEAFRQVRAAKVRVSHVVQIPLLLSSSLRAHATKLPLWLSRERARLLARARRATRIALRAARSFRNYLPFALREAGILAAIGGHRARAIGLLDESCRVARRQGARYELASSTLHLGYLGRKGAAEEAKRELIELGADFDLAPSERPVVLSLADRFTRLLESGRKIVSCLKRDEIFAALETAVQQTLRGDVCTVREPTLVRRPPLQPEWDQLLDRATREGHPVSIPEPLLDTLDTGYPLAGARSALWAPIYVRERLAGALFAKHTRVGGLFSEDELKVVDFLATLAGAALENAAGFARAEEAIRARDEFLQVASHELRTPLTPLTLNIQLVAELLRRERRLEGSSREHVLQRIEAGERQLGRMQTLVDQLLEASSFVTTQLPLALERVDLSALLTSTLEPMAREARASGSEIEIVQSADVVGIWDPHRLRTVIASLVGNALKFGLRRKVVISLSRRDATAVLSVQDLGIGIAEPDRERVFQRFERAVSARHFGGLGLGLYLARQIVEAHGGTIGVESAGTGTGATFVVELPITPPAGTASPS